MKLSLGTVLKPFGEGKRAKEIVTGIYEKIKLYYEYTISCKDNITESTRYYLVNCGS